MKTLLALVGLGTVAYFLFGYPPEPPPVVPGVPRVQPANLGVLGFANPTVRGTLKNQLHALGYPVDDASIVGSSQNFGRSIGIDPILPPQLVVEVDLAFRKRFGD